MTWANLRAADLSGADLSGADLRDAILVGTKIAMWRTDGANMTGALTDERSSGSPVNKMPAAEMLRQLAAVVRGFVRGEDVAARIGGEEFAVLLPSSNAEQAVRVAERMRAAVDQSQIHVRGQPLHFTASFGVAEFQPQELSLESLMARADAALYEIFMDGNAIAAIRRTRRILEMRFHEQRSAFLPNVDSPRPAEIDARVVWKGVPAQRIPRVCKRHDACSVL